MILQENILKDMPKELRDNLRRMVAEVYDYDDKMKPEKEKLNKVVASIKQAIDFMTQASEDAIALPQGHILVAQIMREKKDMLDVLENISGCLPTREEIIAMIDKVDEADEKKKEE